MTKSNLIFDKETIMFENIHFKTFPQIILREVIYIGKYSLVRLVMPNTEELISQPLEGL